MVALTRRQGDQAPLLDDTEVTASAAEINKLDGVTATTAEINKLAGATASTADLNATSGIIGSITVVAANGGADTVDVTITVLDPDGSAITSPLPLHVWLSDLANGTGGSAHTHSAAPAFTTGEEIVEHITNDFWLVLTDENGVAVLQLVDTANEDVTINAASGGILGQDTTVSGDWSA